MILRQEESRFSDPQRSLVFQALGEAEKRTSGYYCIPPFRWEKLHYDLLTQTDQDCEPLPESILARVRHLEKVNTPRPFDFYRIELNDQSILAAAEREQFTKDLYPFFVYILTHEMVHLVRLSSILDRRANNFALLDESEEQRVQRISRRILAGTCFQPVLDRFCD